MAAYGFGIAATILLWGVQFEDPLGSNNPSEL